MKYNTRFSMLLICLCTVTGVIAQTKKDQVLLTVGGNQVTKTEFEKIYKKNNSKDTKHDKKSLEDYLQLYINYKLKVREAEDMKLDTAESFKQELVGYRKQLSQPYLTDKLVSEKLIVEAYERMKKDVHASHILIKLIADPLPKDTLEAYNKALKIRARIIKGEDFGKLAMEASDDPSAKDNKGDLGFFTSMQMVYPFETVAYATKVGEVSMPVRTKFGYHIVKVVETRPGQGDIKAGHIMVKSPVGMDKEDSIKAKAKIDEIYTKLKSGEKFEDLAKQFSEDLSSGRNGGTLPWFGTGRMVPEFENAAFALKKDGDITEPVRTPYGWHIIKRVEKKELPTFTTVQPEIKTKVAKDSRSEMTKLSLVKNIKTEYKFKEVTINKAETFKAFDSTLMQGAWDMEKAKTWNKPLFTLLNKTYTQQDFAKYVSEHQTRRPDVAIEAIASSLYNQFVNETCVGFEESRLDIKYPDFKSLMREYKDGILLFDLTDKKVWSKAVKDTAGLKAFYEKNKAKYMWAERLQATVYSCANADIAKQVRDLLAKGIKTDSMLKVVNLNSQLNLAVKEGKFSKGDNEIVDGIKWEKGLTADMSKNKQVVFVDVKAKLAAEPKTLEEAKGLITADYQAQLEKEWIDTLKKKFPVSVNNEVLKTITP